MVGESAGCERWHGSSTRVGESGNDAARETRLEVFRCEKVRGAAQPRVGVQDQVAGRTRTTVYGA